MNEPEQELKDLIDDYLCGLLDEVRMRELEERLHSAADLRHYFVRYARLHTDLLLEARSRQASERVLGKIEQLARADAASSAPRRSLTQWLFARKFLVPAACLLLSVGLAWGVVKGFGVQDSGRDLAIAWLVNAQNCEWSEEEPTGDMQAGKVLKLERGLAEIRFQCGSRVVLEGPASLELLSGKSARLRNGKLTARVPGPATGFEIVSPQGKVIDLGTEFGISVADSGATDVYVFEGKVEAHPLGYGKTNAVLSLVQNEAARMAEGKIIREPGAKADFVRAILPPPLIHPRTIRLSFDRSVGGSVRDANGLGTGLTDRLPGTGTLLPEHDPNLRLDPDKAQLELTTTRSDLNNKGFRLVRGEYLGVRLSDLGFTGKEDFAVTAIIPNIPALINYDQFGLYAGTKSDRNIRGGLIKWGDKDPAGWNQGFLVNNNGGTDTDIRKVGLLSPGTDLRLTLRRTEGKYSMAVENLAEKGASTLTIRHPDFLDGEADLFVGLFGANPFRDERNTLTIKEFSVTVWTVQNKE